MWVGSEPSQIGQEPIALFCVSICMLTVALLLFAQHSLEPNGRPQNPEDTSHPSFSVAAASAPRITWFTQWSQAVKEAERLNRPILLQGAAPVCSGVPGMW